MSFVLSASKGVSATFLERINFRVSPMTKFSSVSTTMLRAFLSSSTTSSIFPSVWRACPPRYRQRRPCRHSPVLSNTGQVVEKSTVGYCASSIFSSSAANATNGGLSLIEETGGKRRSLGFAAKYSSTLCVLRHLLVMRNACSGSIYSTRTQSQTRNVCP